MDEINLSKQEFKICEAVHLGLTHYYLNNSRDKRFVTPDERAWAVATLPKLPERWWRKKLPVDEARLQVKKCIFKQRGGNMSNGLIKYKADENFGNGLVYSILEVEEVLKKKDDENRRYKRKRCLAMGDWCQANCMHTVLLIGHKIMPHWEWRIKTNYWYKWRERWMKLAEKFQGE